MISNPNLPRTGVLRPWLRLIGMAVPLAVALRWRHHRRMADALNRSQSVLHATREQLDAILNRVPVGIVQTDLAGRVQLVNDRYCTMVAHPGHHLRTLRLIDLVHADDRAQHVERHAQLLATGRPFEIESRLVRSDESHVWVVSHITLTHDTDGRPMHVVAAVQDISNRRETEAALHDLNATLEQRIADAVSERVSLTEELRQAQRTEALGQLAGGVAHDFNNVLQAIEGGARLIRKRPNDPVAVERLAGLVIEAAERGATVTARLTSFARRSPLKPGPVELGPLIEGLLPMLTASIGASIELQTDIADGLPAVMADRGQLETALVNLASNARDALEGELDPYPNPKARVIRITAAVADRDFGGPSGGRAVDIFVIDTGRGMVPEVLEHATEPFFTTKPRSRGTGLGLAMVRGFAEQSGGWLSLKSHAGQGTTVTLTLPMVMQGDAVTSPPGPARIVLVDDDETVRGVLAEVLTTCGFNVVEHGTAAAALADVVAHGAALLVTDLSMPGMDGLTLIREAQQHQPGLPAMLLTGYGSEALALAARRITGGPLALLQKPVRTAELTACAQRLLAK